MSTTFVASFVHTALCHIRVTSFAVTPLVVFSLCVCKHTFVVMNPSTSVFCSALVNVWHIETRLIACKVEDFWHGYKLFCYAFYSHSVEHESEFCRSKLGAANLL